MILVFSNSQFSQNIPQKFTKITKPYLVVLRLQENTVTIYIDYITALNQITVFKLL